MNAWSPGVDGGRWEGDEVDGGWDNDHGFQRSYKNYRGRRVGTKRSRGSASLQKSVRPCRRSGRPRMIAVRWRSDRIALQSLQELIGW